MNIGHGRHASIRLLCEAVITMVIVLVAFAAFDDVTTDTDSSFVFEYSGLAVCGAGVLVLALRLVREGRQALGVISLIALAGAVWGTLGIGPSTVPSRELHYLATAGALVWFAVLSLTLWAMAWRAHPSPPPRTAG